MKSISLPGIFDASRLEQTLLLNEIDAIHGGGTARFSGLFDERKIQRKIIPGISDAFGNYRYAKYFCEFHIPEVFETGIIADFEAKRNLYVIELWNRFSSLAYKTNRYVWSPQDVFDNGGSAERKGEYSLLYSFLYDTKSRYEIGHGNFWNAIFRGTSAFCPGFFDASKGNQKAAYRSSFDTFREWTRNDVYFRYDKNYGGADRCLGTLNAVYDPQAWPRRFMDRSSCLIPNPRILRNVDLFRYDQVDPLPWQCWNYRYDAFLYFFNEYPAHKQSFVRPGWRVMAKNLETGEVAELGFIDAQSPERSLANVSLNDGDYEISVLTSSLFWRDASDGNIRTITVGADPEISPLPVIHNLRSAVADGATTIHWSANHSEIDDCVFGVWFSSESPIDTNRPADATVWYSSSMSEYQTSFAQNAPAWVAIAAMRIGDEMKIGKVHELYLDWSNVKPRTPDDVMILDSPLLAFDTEIEMRHEDDPFMTLWSG